MAKHIGIVGLGKLGAPFAYAFASRGFQVAGVDINKTAVRKLNRGEMPKGEPATVEWDQGNIAATCDFSKLAGCEAVFVVVPTPSDEHNRFSTEYVVDAMSSIGHALKDVEDYAVVVLVSTVMPGDCERVVIPALREYAGDAPLGFCYSPEFIALGQVQQDFLRPDLVVIGQENEQAGRTLAALMNKLLYPDGYISAGQEWAGAIRVMSIVSAEIAKIALNNMLTVRISFANLLAELCEKFPGANVDDVTRALGRDSRIGPKFLRGALGFGGPCLCRDSRAMEQLLREQSMNIYTSLPTATQWINERQIERIALMAAMPAGKRQILIMGQAYKLGTEVTEESQPEQIWERLVDAGRNAEIIPASANRVELQAAIDRAEVIVWALPDPRFLELVYSSEKTIIDVWRLSAGGKMPNAADGVVVVYVGVG